VAFWWQSSRRSNNDAADDKARSPAAAMVALNLDAQSREKVAEKLDFRLCAVSQPEPTTSSQNKRLWRSSIRCPDREQSHVLFNILLIYS
jgi:hypothetical protein